MTNADVSEKPSSNKSKGKDDAQALTMSEILAIRPPINNGKLVYICRDKSFTRPPIAKNKTSKKKMKKNIFLSKPQDIEAQPNNLNLQVDEDFLASRNSSTTQI